MLKFQVRTNRHTNIFFISKYYPTTSTTTQSKRLDVDVTVPHTVNVSQFNSSLEYHCEVLFKSKIKSMVIIFKVRKLYQPNWPCIKASIRLIA